MSRMLQGDAASTEKLLAELWKRNQPLILERLQQLDETAASAQKGMLTEEVRAEAESNAHKLSGSLGMFGYHTGTDFAAQLETELQQDQPEPEQLLFLTRCLRSAIYP